jgi:hypothetical protein
MSLETPVLLLAFNRPEHTARVFEAIRAVAPRRLWIAADGPRAGRPDDVERCAEVRRIVTSVDWECEVDAHLRDANVGCRVNVAEGVDRFFAAVDAGIVLEDDCLPHPSFFRFCEELLDRFRDDERVFAIGGTNLLGSYDTNGSYFFSRYGAIWGWASWRRAWRHYDVDLRAWPQARDEGVLSWLLPPEERAHYEPALEATHRGELDSWDYQWAFARFVNSGLTVLPRVNLVENIGFDADGTHTTDPGSPHAGIPARELEFPLVHPPYVLHDQRFRDRTNALMAPTRRPLARRLARAARHRLANA